MHLKLPEEGIAFLGLGLSIIHNIEALHLI